ncbi:DUF1799 domain-containing protein [Rhodobacter sp. NTK016B]|uniref:DUF1799 domain-containing protein n=1 Tax=Rhodobacter sp. NTK016B TaxID=2759676 RepID=UPI0039C94189
MQPDWERAAGDIEDGIWAEHVSAFEAFLAVSSQWRSDGRRFLGLDYSAVQSGFELAGIDLSTRNWADLRLIEAGARDELNRKP